MNNFTKNPITEEEIDEFSKEYIRREQFVINNGWHLIERQVKHPTNNENFNVKVWHDPVANKLYPYAEGYDQLTMILLRKHSWKAITEILHIGKKNNIKIETWGRFQSPFSERVYSFCEAQYIMEQNWAEDFYPTMCSELTKLRNQLIGDKFQEDTIKTWYYQENGKTIFRLWTD